MEKLTFKDFLNGKGFASYDMRDQIKELNLKDDDILVNLAYTDYGGDVFDKVAIRYFTEKYKENIIKENTCYCGENAFIFGSIAKEFFIAFERYPLGFEDIEELYYQMEREAENESFKSFIDDDLEGHYLFDRAKVKEYLLNEKSGYYSWHTSGIDFSSSDLIVDLIKQGLIFDDDDLLLYAFVSAGYSKEIASYYVTCYQNKTLSGLLLNEKTISIFKEFDSTLTF